MSLRRYQTTSLQSTVPIICRDKRECRGEIRDTREKRETYLFEPKSNEHLPACIQRIKVKDQLMIERRGGGEVLVVRRGGGGGELREKREQVSRRCRYAAAGYGEINESARHSAFWWS
ncbi:hypothetical protein J6590_008871 [Homalodisca vitripennis]|nr:hypothetical protein J6590_008871 [Homalodisca vitripennis]